MFRVGIVAAASLWAGLAQAADQPVYAPPPAWVKPIPIPDVAPKSDSLAIQILLSDHQSRFTDDGDDFYVDSAFRIVSPQGLAFVNGLAPTWNPETDTLTFHRFNIIRGGQTIDLLAGGKKVTVLRRETNLELAMLDGNLTATLQPEGLQVGDVIELAMTLRRNDPVYKGHSEGFVQLPPQVATSRFYVRDLWPAGKPIRWRATEGMPAPVLTAGKDGSELVIDAANAEAPKPPSGAPLRYATLGQLQVTQFKSWSEVSALIAPLYAKAAALGAASPVKAEARKIAAASTDPKTRAEAALRLVQDQLRYTFVGLNLGGLVPADADVTWARRFGDCKGKTVVLLALLHELGIAAEPALINSAAGDVLSARLPMLAVFDHVIVRAVIGGKVYWLDGTRSGDRNLDDIAVPNFHWALPVSAAGSELEKLEPKGLDAPEFDSVMRIDASAGIDAPAPTHIEHVLRGDAAVGRDIGLTALSPADAERSMRDYWRSATPWVTVSRVTFKFDDAHRLLRLTMDGMGTVEWTRNGAVRDFDLGDSSLGFRPSFQREPGPGADAPFTVPFPVFNKWTDIVVLPRHGEGFSLLEGASVDMNVAGRHYLRSSTIENGTVTMVASEQTLAPEFPNAEASAAATALRQLTAYDVAIRVEAAPAVAVEQPDDTPEIAPKTAGEFATRGERFLMKRDFTHAIADFDQSLRLDPSVAKVYYNRGVARLESGGNALAIADFNQALKLNPADVTALQGRAEYYLLIGDLKSAKADFDEAIRLVPGDDAMLHRIANAYEATGHFEGAVRIYDGMIAKKPTAELYNAGCWFRAEWGHELEQAVADCDAALKLSPDNPAMLDSRGLAKLQMGHYDDAIADYDEALRLTPDEADSLFGRGVAEVRKNDHTAGEADLARARALRPRIDAEFRKRGVTP